MKESDIRLFKKLGLTRYIESMSITHILPEIDRVVSISKSAKKRLKWIDHYTKCQNVTQTCRYFGISRKTLYIWLKRYNPNNLTSRLKRKAVVQRELEPGRLPEKKSVAS